MLLESLQGSTFKAGTGQVVKRLLSDLLTQYSYLQTFVPLRKHFRPQSSDVRLG